MGWRSYNSPGTLRNDAWVTTSDSDENTGSDGWRFDPDHPPAVWTREMFGRLTVGDIRRLEKPDNGLLSPESQASFDEVKAEWTKAFADKIRPAIAAMMPKIDTSALVSPALRESMERIQNNLAAQLDFSKTLGVRASVPAAWDVDRPIVEPVRRAVVPAGTSADDFEHQVVNNADNLVALQTIANVVTAQSNAAARGAIFYVVVGLATTLAGVASVVAMDNWHDRWVTIGVTMAFGVLAVLGYVVVLWRQRRKAEQQA